MAKRFILGVLLLLLYMGLYALLLIGYIDFIGPQLDPDLQEKLLGVLAVGAFVFYFPWFFWTTKIIWFFKAEGPAVPLSELKKEILSINEAQSPILVTEDTHGNFKITWHYLDAKWRDLLFKAGETKIYELLIKFDEKKKEVRLIDVIKGSSWSRSIPHLHLDFTYFRGALVSFETGKAWGIKENFQPGKIYDYRFDSSEIKNPVMNTILKRGWNVRFSMY